MPPAGDSSVPESQRPGPASDVLDCWKDIAVYLQRNVRTVMRWEHTRGLPVHRLPGGGKAAIYALKSELDAWRAARSDTPDADRQPSDEAPSRFGRRALLLFGAVALAAAAAVVAGLAWKRETVAPTPIRSLAVLPFDNLSRDPAQDYFADGIYEALITDLARDGSVRVVSRTSAAQYRGARLPAQTIARELDADGLVEGSVLRVGNRVRITAQLIRAASDEHLWADTYEWDVGDVLDSMAQVSAAITGGIRRAITSGAPSAPAPPPARTLSPEAVDAYLRAQYSFHMLTRDGMDNALRLYRTAIELDPRFAHAWRGLASVRTGQAFFGYVAAADVLPEAREAARRAIELDPRMGEAYGALGYIALYWDWDFDDAGKRLARALELAPNATMLRHIYADYLLIRADPERSLAQVRMAVASDPVSWPARGILLYHSLMARHYDEAIAEGQKMIGASPVHGTVHDYLGRAFWMTGRHHDAVVEWKAAAASTDDGTFFRVEQAYERDGPRAALLARGEAIAARASRGVESAVQAASCFAFAGDADRAFYWLDQSYLRREPFLLHIVADPFFDPIRPDPRFGALLARIGVTPTSR